MFTRHSGDVRSLCIAGFATYISQRGEFLWPTNYEVTMSSTDERIKKILKQKEERDAAQASARAEANKANKEDPIKVKGKWEQDTSVIKAAVASLQDKLLSHHIKFSFQFKPGVPGTIGVPGTTIMGQAEFLGTVGNAIGKMLLNIFETGVVRVDFDGKASEEFDLMQADQEMYESILLDLVERLITKEDGTLG
jgi:hypothetical protein